MEFQVSSVKNTIEETRNIHNNINKKTNKRSREPLRNITNDTQEFDKNNIMDDGEPPAKKPRISKSNLTQSQVQVQVQDEKNIENIYDNNNENKNDKNDKNDFNTEINNNNNNNNNSNNNNDNNNNQIDSENEDGNENEDKNENENEDENKNENENVLDKWDCEDINNEYMATAYVKDIMKVLKNAESLFAINNDYMISQNDINSKMRIILLDWLVEVHRKFQLLSATFYLSINLIDRYLSKTQVHRSKLQLIGCACLWIACKYHEIYAPEIQDFVYISDKAFTKDDLIATEVDVVEKLDFSLTVATPLSFAERFNKIGVHHLKNEKERSDATNLCFYLIEHCLMDYDLARDAPSKISAACLAYTLLGTRLLTTWPHYLIRETKYELKDLYSIIEKIDAIVKNPKCKHRAIRKKYSQSKYSRVALLNFTKLNLRIFYE